MKSKKQSQSIRIIAGLHRGRKLAFVDQVGLRPTGDRMRETLFNWLQAVLSDAVCLDVFSGSGALGFEAYSRGAKLVTLLELTSMQARQLARNVEILNADSVSVIQTNALDWLSKRAISPYDVIFLDPPFADNLLQQSIDFIVQGEYLADQGYVYLEADVDQNMPTLPENWRVQKDQKMGRVQMCLWQRM